jgi:hypothetical protein
LQAGGKVEQVAVKPKDLRAHYSDDELDGLVSNDEEGDEGAARAFMGKYSLTPHTHAHAPPHTHTRATAHVGNSAWSIWQMTRPRR